MNKMFFKKVIVLIEIRKISYFWNKNLKFENVVILNLRDVER